MKNVRRVAIGAVSAIGLVILTASVALAQAVDPSGVTIDGAETVWTELGESFAGIAPFGAGAIALFVGWRVIKRLVHA